MIILLPNREWNQKQKHKKQPWGKVECFAFGGREVSKALKNYKIVNEENILWRLVAVGNG